MTASRNLEELSVKHMEEIKDVRTNIIILREPWFWDVPGGSVMNTLLLHCRRQGFCPWLGKFHAMWPKRKKETVVLFIILPLC